MNPLTSRAQAEAIAAAVHLADHCPACRVARELTEHRDSTAHRWSERRAAFNFARVLATRACPNYKPAKIEEPS